MHPDPSAWFGGHFNPDPSFNPYFYGSQIGSLQHHPAQQMHNHRTPFSPYSHQSWPNHTMLMSQNAPLAMSGASSLQTPPADFGAQSSAYTSQTNTLPHKLSQPSPSFTSLAGSEQFLAPSSTILTHRPPHQPSQTHSLHHAASSTGPMDDAENTASSMIDDTSQRSSSLLQAPQLPAAQASGGNLLTSSPSDVLLAPQSPLISRSDSTPSTTSATPFETETTSRLIPPDFSDRQLAQSSAIPEPPFTLDAAIGNGSLPTAGHKMGPLVSADPIESNSGDLATEPSGSSSHAHQILVEDQTSEHADSSEVDDVMPSNDSEKVTVVTESILKDGYARLKIILDQLSEATELSVLQIIKLWTSKEGRALHVLHTWNIYGAYLKENIDAEIEKTFGPRRKGEPEPFHYNPITVIDNVLGAPYTLPLRRQCYSSFKKRNPNYRDLLAAYEARRTIANGKQSVGQRQRRFIKEFRKIRDNVRLDIYLSSIRSYYF